MEQLAPQVEHLIPAGCAPCTLRHMQGEIALPAMLWGDNLNHLVTGKPSGEAAMMMKGYVTTLESISGRANSELEQILGFSSGSLSAGFSVYALEGRVAMDEFDWRDRTRYSGGWHADPSIKFGSDPNTVWQVQRRDELRAALDEQHNYNEQATDQAIEGILQVELEKLNVRTGLRMIVKVVPRQRFGDYPNSPYRNIPQWELKVLKPFRLL